MVDCSQVHFSFSWSERLHFLPFKPDQKEIKLGSFLLIILTDCLPGSRCLLVFKINSSQFQLWPPTEQILQSKINKPYFKGMNVGGGISNIPDIWKE